MRCQPTRLTEWPRHLKGMTVFIGSMNTKESVSDGVKLLSSPASFFANGAPVYFSILTQTPRGTCSTYTCGWAVGSASAAPTRAWSFGCSVMWTTTPIRFLDEAFGLLQWHEEAHAHAQVQR